MFGCRGRGKKDTSKYTFRQQKVFPSHSKKDTFPHPNLIGKYLFRYRPENNTTRTCPPVLPNHPHPDECDFRCRFTPGVSSQQRTQFVSCGGHCERMESPSWKHDHLQKNTTSLGKRTCRRAGNAVDRESNKNNSCNEAKLRKMHKGRFTSVCSQRVPAQTSGTALGPNCPISIQPHPTPIPPQLQPASSSPSPKPRHTMKYSASLTVGTKDGQLDPQSTKDGDCDPPVSSFTKNKNPRSQLFPPPSSCIPHPSPSPHLLPIRSRRRRKRRALWRLVKLHYDTYDFDIDVFTSSSSSPLTPHPSPSTEHTASTGELDSVITSTIDAHTVCSWTEVMVADEVREVYEVLKNKEKFNSITTHPERLTPLPGPKSYLTASQVLQLEKSGVLKKKKWQDEPIVNVVKAFTIPKASGKARLVVDECVRCWVYTGLLFWRWGGLGAYGLPKHWPWLLPSTQNRQYLPLCYTPPRNFNTSITLLSREKVPQIRQR